MSVGENIFNAFEIVNKTHENVSKLMAFCERVTAEKKEFCLISKNFLRHKSDAKAKYDYWNLTHMFLLFQDMEDKLLKNGLRNGPIYLLEILLYDKEVEIDYNEPIISMVKLEYEDIKSFLLNGQQDYWHFHNILYAGGAQEIENGIFAEDMSSKIDGEYRGIKRVVYKEKILADVNYENAYDIIFGGFKELKNK